MSREFDPIDLLAASLAGLLPDAAPPADAAARLRASLLAHVSPPVMRVTRADEGAWTELLPGIRIKRLRADAPDGSETTLWRLDPGAALPAHPHDLDEECLVLEGSVVLDDIEYRTGDYLLAPRGLQHGMFVAPAGALLLIRGERRMDRTPS